MSTEAVIIGPLAAAVFYERELLTAVQLDGEFDIIECPRHIGLFLSSAAETKILAGPVTRDAVYLQLRHEVAKHRALTFILAGADRDLTSDNRLSSVVLAEKALRSAEIRHFVEARLLGRKAPDEADFGGAQQFASDGNARVCKSLYTEVISYGPLIPRVIEHFHEIILHERIADYDFAPAMRALTDLGVVAAAVRSVGQRDRAKLNSLAITYSHSGEEAKDLPKLIHLLARMSQRLRDDFELPATQRTNNVAIDDNLDDVWISEIYSWSNARVEHRERFKEHPSTWINVEAIRQKVDHQVEYIERLIRKGDFAGMEDAVLELIRYQRINSDLEHVCKSLSRLGALALGYYEYQLAARLYTTARAANSSDTVPLSGYAEVLRKTGRLEEALAIHQATRDRLGSDPIPFGGYAQALLEMGREDEALAAYEEAKTLFPDDSVVFGGYADTLRQLGRADEALAAYSEQKVRFPNEPAVFCGYAETLQEMGSLDEALEAYSKTKTLFPHDSVAFCGYAETLRELGRLDHALAAYSQTRERFPNTAVPFCGYADTFRDLGLLEQALAAYSEARTQFPHDPFVLHGHAQTLRDMGNPTDALQLYLEARPRFEVESSFVRGHAETLREMGRFDDALRAYSKAKEQFKFNSVILNGYASVLRDLGRFDEALSAYLDAASRFQTQPISLCGYAATLLDMGSVRAAETAYRGAMERFPRDRVAINGLASLLVNHGKPNEALDLLPERLPRARDEWRDYHVSAMANYAMGNPAEAIRRLEFGIEHALFAKVKSVFRCTLAALRLRNKQSTEALRLLHSPNNVVPFPEWAIVRAHALAETSAREDAEAELRQIAAVTRLKPIIRIMSRVYGLGESPAPQGLRTVLMNELWEEELRLLTSLAA